MFFILLGLILLSIMLSRVNIFLMVVKELCIELIVLVEVIVVELVKRIDWVNLKCCFLFFIVVFVRCVVVLWLENLVVVMVNRLMVNRMIIVVSIVLFCCIFFIIFLKVWGSENGMSRMRKILSMFVYGCGFLKGWDELLLKKLLLLVLSFLMVFWEVMGFFGMIWFLLVILVMCRNLVKFWIVLLMMSRKVVMVVIGIRMCNV